MAIARCYVTSIQNASVFTNTGNLVGYNSATSTNSSSQPNFAGLGPNVYMDLGKIPAGSTVNNINFKITASATGSRAVYSFALKTLTTSPVVLKTNQQNLTASLATYTVSMTRADLLGAGFTDASILNSGNLIECTLISTSTATVTTTIEKIWAEVDFTPPANHQVTDVTLSADTASGDTSSWTTPENAIAEDNAYASLTRTSIGFNSFYFTSSGINSIPSNAIIKGILFEIDYKVSVTSSSPLFWLKFFGFSDAIWGPGNTPGSVLAITTTNEMRHIIGGYSEPMSRTRGGISDSGNYMRVSQSTTTSTVHQIDSIRLQIYWELPISGNAMFFGENF